MKLTGGLVTKPSSTSDGLRPEQLRKVCDPVTLRAQARTVSTDQPLYGQDRAMRALELSIEIRQSDFNLYVLGPQGTGRHTSVERLLRKHAQTRPVPSDWVYVNNFDAPHRPVAMELPTGMGAHLKTQMERIVDDLATEIPALLESDEYQVQRRELDERLSERQDNAMSDFAERAEAENVALIRTPVGFMVAASRDGQVIKADEYDKLPEAEQDEIDEKISRLEEELKAVLRNVPKLEREHRANVEALNAEMAERVVSSSIDEAQISFGRTQAVSDYLERVRTDMIENTELFLQSAARRGDGPFPEATGKSHRDPLFTRYMVNVMVSNTIDGPRSAPVVFEDLPSLDRLTGRIEHVSEMGSLTTDFTLIRPGALHQANGGFLVLDAAQVLTEPLSWDSLKRCLKRRAIRITSLADRMSLFSTMSLEPDTIPLDVRVVLLGDRFLHALLVMLDPEFLELFKVQADFEDSTDRTEDSLVGLLAVLRSYVAMEKLLPLSDDGGARLLDEATRLAQDTRKLTLRLSPLTDILREGEHYARARGGSDVGRADIQKAVDERETRASRVRDRVHDAIARRTVVINTDGSEVGQVNGLSVHELGDYRFGRPSRITARSRMGTGKLVDIEREVKLGGPFHSKGVMILSGYLAATYALDVPFSMHASLVFEQSYGEVDGDSASCAELVALLSSLSGLPVRQSLAITGSVNQLGEVQAIGGVNVKVEGFFDICADRGLTGDQGVVIPAANVDHLMLRDRVVDAVEMGRFNIYAVGSVDEALERMLGVQAGKRDDKGQFPERSVNALVETRLRAFALQRKGFMDQGGDKAT